MSNPSIFQTSLGSHICKLLVGYYIFRDSKILAQYIIFMQQDSENNVADPCIALIHAGHHLKYFMNI